MGVFCLLLLMQAAPSPDTISVMAFNVRYDNPDDGPSAWPHRNGRVASVMEQASIVGVQEALHHQVMDLEGRLEGYDWIGVGRDDGIDQGEFAPIFYRSDVFDVLDSGTFWLSETPEVPGSRSWDAAITRIATWGLFRVKASEDSMWVFNTHFDHRGQIARERSAELLMERIEKMVGSGRVAVTGDFNATPDTPVYASMTGGMLSDTRLMSQTSPAGPEGTFSGFVVRDDLPGRRIDYVFVSAPFEVLTYEAVVDISDGRYVSDHLPVHVTLRLNPK